jgi:hypothetical protein
MNGWLLKWRMVEMTHCASIQNVNCNPIIIIIIVVVVVVVIIIIIGHEVA